MGVVVPVAGAPSQAPLPRPGRPRSPVTPGSKCQLAPCMPKSMRGAPSARNNSVGTSPPPPWALRLSHETRPNGSQFPCCFCHSSIRIPLTTPAPRPSRCCVVHLLCSWSHHCLQQIRHALHDPALSNLGLTWPPARGAATSCETLRWPGLVRLCPPSPSSGRTSLPPINPSSFAPDDVHARLRPS